VVIPTVFLVLALLLAHVFLAPQTITCLTVNAHLASLDGTQLKAQLSVKNVVIPIVMLVLVPLLAHAPLAQQIITCLVVLALPVTLALATTTQLLDQLPQLTAKLVLTTV